MGRPVGYFEEDDDFDDEEGVEEGVGVERPQESEEGDETSVQDAFLPQKFTFPSEVRSVEECGVRRRCFVRVVPLLIYQQRFARRR